MWSSDRRSLVFLLCGGALAGCGFKPVHRESGPATGLQGKVLLQEATSPEEFSYRERLRRRLGDANEGEARWRLSWSLSFEEDGVAITRADDITRFRVTGAAQWSLVLMGTESAAKTDGTVRVTGGYDATASSYAVLAAARDERKRMAIEMAELTATRIFAAAEAPR